MGFVQDDYTRQEALESVGPGWADIVGPLWDFCKAQTPPVMIEQVKEKWGGLRWYVGDAPGIVHKRIEEAEALSYTICEECGKPGKPRKGGWVKTLCDHCADNRPLMVWGDDE